MLTTIIEKYIDRLQFCCILLRSKISSLKFCYFAELLDLVTQTH
tara:strand:- start:281 stop:412 length:132 start_codon:yes stop_codon:yes gene_type:complete